MTRQTKPDAPAAPLFLLLLILALHLLAGKPAGVESADPAIRENVLIHVTGNAARPGVYACPGPPDPYRLIRRAGGPEPAAAGAPVQKGGAMLSGSEVRVLPGGSGPAFALAEMPAHYKVTLGIPIALNRESAEGLAAIPGIGPKTAEAIVAERAGAGRFDRPDQLLAVEGIGSAKLTRMMPYVTLESNDGRRSRSPASTAAAGAPAIAAGAAGEGR